jgi:hypothetical protein
MVRKKENSREYEENRKIKRKIGKELMKGK